MTKKQITDKMTRQQADRFVELLGLHPIGEKPPLTKEEIVERQVVEEQDEEKE